LVAATVTDPAVEDAIRARAPGRRAMLRLVCDDERPATELADAAGLSRSAASQHLKLLRDVDAARGRIADRR
jgi:DNA-binding transcriptional ArsR family regulator